MICSIQSIILLEIIIFVSSALESGLGNSQTALNVRLNKTVYIRCPFYSAENTAKYGYWSYTNIVKKIHLDQLICLKAPQNDKCVYSDTEWNKKNIPQINSGEIEVEFTTEFIKISRVQKRHFGEYTCKLDERETVIHLNVLSPPEQPDLSLISPATQIVENLDITLICKTKGANPKPRIWFKWQKTGYDDPQNSFDNYNSSETQMSQSKSEWVPFEETEIRIKWTPKHNFSGFKLFCIASNSEKTVTSRSITLDIAYRPVIDAFINQPYYVMIKSEVDVECKAKSHELYMRFWWTSPNGKIVSNNSRLVLRNVQLSHDGIYSCFVNNSIGTSSKQLQVQVLTAPIIEIPEHKSVILYQQLELTCYSMPHAHNTSWISIETGKVISNDKKLSIRISDIRPIKLMCRIFMKLPRTNQKSVVVPFEKSISFNVAYKPGPPSITASPASVLLLGKPLTLSCIPNKSRPGFPKAMYYWHRQNNKRWYRNQTNFISFSNIKYKDADVYVCTTANSIGKTEEPALFELVVEGEPQARSKDGENSGRVRKNVKFQSHFKIECQFEGFPQPVVKWYKNDQLISPNQGTVTTQHTIEDQSLSQTVINSIFTCGKKNQDQSCHSDQKNLTYTITCAAYNKYGVNRIITDIRNQYPPSLLSSDTIVSCDKFGFTSTREPIKLNCTVQGSQVGLTIGWRKWQSTTNENDLSIPVFNGSRYKFYTHNRRLGLNSGDNVIRTIVLQIEEFEESRDYGRYVCVASNKYGEIKSLFEIQSFSQPDSPVDLKVDKVFWNSIRLSWIPGYHGGYKQQFKVNYTSNNKLENKMVSTYQSSITITKLLPNTKYTITLYSHNELGAAPTVLKTTAKTRSTVGKSKNLFLRRPDLPDSLSLNLPLESPSIYCLQVEKSLTKYQWQPLGVCMPANSDVRVTLPSSNLFYRARICYSSRVALCSGALNIPNSGKSQNTPITAQIIGTVAAVCVALVVLLAIFLFLILLRSKRSTLQFDFAQLTRKTDKKVKTKHDKMNNRPPHILKLSSSSSKFHQSNDTSTIPTYYHDNTTTHLTTPNNTTPTTTTNIFVPPTGYCSLLNAAGAPNTYACMTNNRSDESSRFPTLSHNDESHQNGEGPQFECINFCMDGNSTLPHHFRNHHLPQQTHHQQQQQQQQEYFFDNQNIYSTLLKSNTISPLAINLSGISTVSRSMPNEIADWCCHDNNIVGELGLMPPQLPTFTEQRLPPIFSCVGETPASTELNSLAAVASYPPRTLEEEPQHPLLSSTTTTTSNTTTLVPPTVTSTSSSSCSNNHQRIFYEAMV